MNYKKGLLWGGALGLLVGLSAGFLGPSPLVIPFAPIISILYFPIATLGGELFMYGLGGGGMLPKIIFLVWSVIVLAGVGDVIQRIVHSLRK